MLVNLISSSKDTLYNINLKLDIIDHGHYIGTHVIPQSVKYKPIIF